MHLLIVPARSPRLECGLLLCGALAAGLLASTATISMALLRYPSATGASGPPLVDGGLVVWGTLANELSVGTLVALYLWLRRRSFRRLLPLGVPSGRELGGTLLVVVGTVPWAQLAASLAGSVSGEASTSMQALREAVRAMTASQMVSAYLVLALLPALVEEALFRGVTTACFAASWTEALVVPSLLFGAFHLDPEQAAGTAVLGMAFGVVRLSTRSVVACMIAHGGYNAAALWLMHEPGALGTSWPKVVWQPLLLGGLLLVLGLWVLGVLRRRGRVIPGGGAAGGGTGRDGEGNS